MWLPAQGRRAGARQRRAWTGALAIVALATMLSGGRPVARADSMLEGELLSDVAANVVRRAQRLALKQLSRRPACRALFKSLGYSGAQLVADATFKPASPAERRQICQRRRGALFTTGGALFTTVGGAEITLCPEPFLRLSTRTQAALLLHEALHHAGVSEQPFDPDGLTPEALTRLVEHKCRL